MINGTNKTQMFSKKKTNNSKKNFLQCPTLEKFEIDQSEWKRPS